MGSVLYVENILGPTQVASDYIDSGGNCLNVESAVTHRQIRQPNKRGASFVLVTFLFVFLEALHRSSRGS